MDGRRAQGQQFAMRIVLPAAKQDWLLALRNGVLRAAQGCGSAKPALTMTASMAEVMALFEKRLSPEEAAQRGLLQGDAAPLVRFLELLDAFRSDFNIVEP